MLVNFKNNKQQSQSSRPSLARMMSNSINNPKESFPTSKAPMVVNQQEVNDLIITNLLKERNIQFSMYSGVATSILETYDEMNKSRVDFENYRQSGQEEIDDKRNSIESDVRNYRNELLSGLSGSMISAREEYNSIKDVIENQKTSRKQLINDKIKEITESYETQYNEILDEVQSEYDHVQKIISNFGIRRRKVDLGDIEDMPDVSDLVELARHDAKLINLLSADSVDQNEVDKIEKEKSESLEGSTASSNLINISSSVGKAVIGFGKKIFDIARCNKYIGELEEEILKCSSLIKIQLDEIKDSYCKPDVSQLLSDLENVDRDVGNEYKNHLQECSDRLGNLKSNESNEKINIEQKVAEKKKQLEAELSALRQKYVDTSKQKNEIYKRNVNNYNSKLEEFKAKQIMPNLEYNPLIDKTKELNGLLDNIRIYNTLDVLNGLEYSEPPTTKDPEEHMRYKYDLELKEEIVTKTDKMNSLLEQGLTKEVLEEKVKDLQKQLDEFYKPKFKNIHGGYQVLSDNLKTALGAEDEIYNNTYDNKSLLFIYDTKEDEVVLSNYIKYIMQQIMFNYHPDALNVNIINPSMSTLFNTIQVNLDKVNPDTQEVVEGKKYSVMYNQTQEIDSIQSELENSTARLMQSELSEVTFDELVQKKRDNGAVTPIYNFNILHRVEFNSKFKVYNEEAGILGQINIYLMPKNKFLEFDEEKKKYKVIKSAKEFISDIGIIAETKKVNGDNIIYLTDLYDNSITKFKYSLRDRSEELRMSKLIKERGQNVKGVPVLTEEFIDATTGGKYWQEDATKIVKLYFGYIDGDKSKPVPTVLNEDDKVHMFIGGTTGGGKSNVLSVMVNSLKMMYSPSELDIIYFDFKVVEVAAHTKPYKMPHCTAMSGTGEAAYLMSLLDYCDVEMMRRYALFKKYGVLKLSELIREMKKEIKALREQGRDEEADKLFRSMPRRMVMIVDEAAQAFQHEDNAVVEKVKLTFIRIAQLARAAGIHMILVSQDPAKMPAEVMNLLKVRGCTKANPQISKEIMNGNDICGRSENQFIGFFATNDNPTGDESANKKYVVPLNLPEATKRLTKIAFDMAREDIYRNAVLFDEDEEYTDTRHNLYLDNCKDKKINPYNGKNILLGEPVYFVEEFKPHQIELKADDMNNLAVMSADTGLKEDLFRTITESLDSYGDFWPIYCKSVPNFAPLEYFENKAERDGDKNFTFFCGKGVFPTEMLDSPKYKYIHEQFFAGDLREKGTTPEERQNFAYCFVDVLREFTAFRKSQKRCDKPLYIFMFDMEKHLSVVNAMIQWKDFASAINDANSANIHLIYFGTNVSTINGRGFIGKFIVGKLGDDSNYSKEFKKVPNKFCKLIDTLESTNTAMFKPIKYSA